MGGLWTCCQERWHLLLLEGFCIPFKQRLGKRMTWVSWLKKTHVLLTIFNLM